MCPNVKLAAIKLSELQEQLLKQKQKKKLKIGYDRQKQEVVQY